MNYTVKNSRLPLAVYREVAAHVALVDGVTIELTPQSSSSFDYTLSQIGSLQIQFSDAASTESRAQVDSILAYYGDRFGAWERHDLTD